MGFQNFLLKEESNIINHPLNPIQNLPSPQYRRFEHETVSVHLYPNKSMPFCIPELFQASYKGNTPTFAVLLMKIVFSSTNLTTSEIVFLTTGMNSFIFSSYPMGKS